MRTSLAAVLVAATLGVGGSAAASTDEPKPVTNQTQVCPRPQPGYPVECFTVEVRNCVTPEGELVAQVCVNLGSVRPKPVRGSVSTCTEVHKRKPGFKKRYTVRSKCTTRFVY